MRFVLNTRTDNTGVRVCVHDLAERLRARGFHAVVGDWDGYASYDVAVFMGVDAEIKAARAANPTIKLVIGDPKQSSARYVETAQAGDLLLVSSVEQREAFQRLNANALVYPMFPDLGLSPRAHRETDETLIGYHGNKVHIVAMGQHVAPALEALAKRRSIRLRLVYNVEKLGRASKGLPDPAIVPTEHVQWTPDVYAGALAEVDVGIVPNLLPVRDPAGALRALEVPDLDVNYEPFDFLTRYKASANQGRTAVFGDLGVPVVTDFTPSAAQLIEDGVHGHLVGGVSGWAWALDRLSGSAALRSEMGAALRARVAAVKDAAFEAFLRAVEAPSAGAPIVVEGERSIDEDLAAYRPPPKPTLAERALRRVRRGVLGE